jgi:hypothetical protein
MIEVIALIANAVKQPRLWVSCALGVVCLALGAVLTADPGVGRPSRHRYAAKPAPSTCR